MLVDDVISECRRILNDVDKLEFSDEELLQYLNNSLDIIENILLNKNSSILLDKLTLISNITTLPLDLLRIETIYKPSTKVILRPTNNVELSSSKEYLVFGNKLEILEPPCILIYSKRFKRYNMSEEIEYDYFFNNCIKDYVVASAKSRILDYVDLEKTVINDMTALISRYVYSRDGLPKLKRYDDYE